MLLMLCDGHALRITGDLINTGYKMTHGLMLLLIWMLHGDTAIEIPTYDVTWIT